MKKILFLIFAVLLLSTLCLCVYAEEISVEATVAEDILSAVAGATEGDEVTVVLQSDIVLADSVAVDKAMVLTVNFNGYQISYTGTSGKNTTTAAFTLKNDGAVLNLNGSNRLENPQAYTHYGHDIKADMVGTGNLIGIEQGSVAIRDAYLYATDETFVIYAGFVKNANVLVTVNSSVLRTKEGAQTSAISYCGGNGHNDSVVKKQLFIYDSVEYGGFKGTAYAFNVTRSSEFKNVLFYDFAITNDNWLGIGALFTGSFENAILFEDCIFNSYEGKLAPISVKTETGKNNIKLWNCQFTEIVNGGKFAGDSGGDARIYVVEVIPTCEESGTAYSYSCARGANGTLAMENYKKESFTISKLGHDREGDGQVVYRDGYTKVGTTVKTCSRCGAEAEGDVVFAPIFADKGFSANSAGTSITRGISIDVEAYEAYLLAGGAELELGVLVGAEGTCLEVADGALVVTGGYTVSIKDMGNCYFEVKISGFSDETRVKPFVAEFYAFDGVAVTYLKDNFDTVEEHTAEEIVEMLDEIKMAAKDLLVSKHRLYYNEDGSFRVMILADLHVSPSSNTTALEERIKTLVDRENPNLVILTGDNTVSCSNATALRTALSKIVGYIEEKEIPWCHVFGNHDREGGLSNEAQMAVYQSFEYCISKDEGGEGVNGVGNYVHGIYNRDGSLGSVIYFLDSGTSNKTYSYDYIDESQIEWYRSSSRLLETYKGEVVKGIMAFHIPLIENQYAYNNRNNESIVYEYTGTRYEAICPSTFDTELFETVLARGDVEYIVTGHDHNNDYMYNYYGVKLSSAPTISTLGYSSSAAQEGARMFDISRDGISSYVSYIIERVNPDDYDEFAGDVLLETFEDGTATFDCSGLDSSNLSGTMTATVAEGRLEIVRSASGNSEIAIMLDTSKYGKLGSAKYLVVRVDFTNVEFRKACFGLQ